MSALTCNDASISIEELVKRAARIDADGNIRFALDLQTPLEIDAGALVPDGFGTIFVPNAYSGMPIDTLEMNPVSNTVFFFKFNVPKWIELAGKWEIAIYWEGSAVAVEFDITTRVVKNGDDLTALTDTTDTLVTGAGVADELNTDDSTEIVPFIAPAEGDQIQCAVELDASESITSTHIYIHSVCIRPVA